MKKVLEYVKQYWLTVIFGIGFILLYKYISDNKLFSAMMFPSLGKIWEAFWKERDIMLKNMLSSFEYDSEIGSDSGKERAGIWT